MISKKWNEIESDFNAIMSDIFIERIFNEIPENQKEAEEANQIIQTRNLIIKSLKDI
jgi:hypothetical protein